MKLNFSTSNKKPSPLPIDELLPKIVDSLSTHRNLVLVAAPGAGKTTRVPPALLDSKLIRPPFSQILVLQPRRVAARATAARIAEERGVQLGDEVGYQVRFENRTSAQTRLRIVTEGILERMLTQDPELKGVGAVVLDEFHERSLHSDLSIALLRELQQSFRPDLMIIVMSATLETQKISRFLGDAPVIESAGRSYPVEVSYAEQSLTPASRPQQIVDEVMNALKRVREQNDDGRDILVFLPGAGEISRCVRRSAERFPDLVAVGLHGSLQAGEQDLALKASNKRRVIFSTNIAETSLTLDGVSTVIDSGLARILRCDPQFGMDRLELSRISKSSATQRQGRAGRQYPGRCHRLWTRHDQTQLEESIAPEIFRSDLAPTLLLLAEWGVQDFAKFPWFESPQKASFANATQLLVLLKSISPLGADQFAITPLGKNLLRWPAHPRWARVLEASVNQGFLREATQAVALLTEKDILRGDDSPVVEAHHDGSDLTWRLLLLQELEARSFQNRDPSVDAGAARNVARTASAIERLAARSHSAPSKTRDFAELHKTLLLGFADRVAKRRKGRDLEARMVGGRGLQISEKSVAKDSDLFICLDPREARIQGKLISLSEVLAPIEESWLREVLGAECIQTKRRLEWNAQQSRTVAWNERCFMDLPLSEATPSQPTSDESRSFAAKHLVEDFESFLQNRERESNLVKRLRWLAHQAPDLEWPTFSENAFFQKLILDFLELGAGGIDELPLESLVKTLLSTPQIRFLDTEAPASLTVPSASVIPIRYPSHPQDNPIVAVRLQEIFGLTVTPRLVRGQVPVTFELLSPGYKPVQTTSDLESFWTRGYVEVKRELRARYPRHSWPDDPLSAAPVAKGRPRRN